MLFKGHLDLFQNNMLLYGRPRHDGLEESWKKWRLLKSQADKMGLDQGGGGNMNIAKREELD